MSTDRISVDLNFEIIYFSIVYPRVAAHPEHEKQDEQCRRDLESGSYTHGSHFGVFRGQHWLFQTFGLHGKDQIETFWLGFYYVLSLLVMLEVGKDNGSTGWF